MTSMEKEDRGYDELQAILKLKAILSGCLNFTLMD